MSETPDPYDDERPARRGPPGLAISAGVLAVVVVAGLLFLFGPFGRSERAGPAEAPSASGNAGSLSVGVSNAPPDQFAADRPLRCFVDGRFTGLQTLAECARLNGVNAAALDVGVDDTGALAAATDTVLAPAPVEMVEDIETAQVEAAQDVSPALPPLERPAPPPPQRVVATGPCWRDGGGGGWERVGDDLTLADCTRVLFDGQCVVQPGSALYGRWSEETLRLVPGRVEAGGSGGRFRTLSRQPPGSCSVGPM